MRRDPPLFARKTFCPVFISSVKYVHMYEQKIFIKTTVNFVVSFL